MSSTHSSQDEIQADDVLRELLKINPTFLSAGFQDNLTRLQTYLGEITRSRARPSPDERRILITLAKSYLPRWLNGLPIRGASPLADNDISVSVPGITVARSLLDELLDGYDDVTTLSQSALAHVYKAKYPAGHERAEQDVILKVQVPADSDSAIAWQAEHYALQTLMRVGHPHIVAMNAARITPYPCIEMEYLPGGDLAQEFGSVFDPAEAATIALFIAQAIWTAHDLGIYHHDIRPQNVLFDHKRQPKLIDWGMSRRASANHSVSPADDFFRNHTIDPSYAAPEQLESRFGVNLAKTDVYQLGLLLYDMLTGSEDIDTRMTDHGALDFTPSSLSEQMVTSVDIDCILEGALKKMVTQRCTLDEFGLDLANFLDRPWKV